MSIFDKLKDKASELLGDATGKVTEATGIDLSGVTDKVTEATGIDLPAEGLTDQATEKFGDVTNR